MLHEDGLHFVGAVRVDAEILLVGRGHQVHVGFVAEEEFLEVDVAVLVGKVEPTLLVEGWQAPGRGRLEGFDAARLRHVAHSVLLDVHATLLSPGGGLAVA